jgi:hypothetical protein
VTGHSSAGNAVADNLKRMCRRAKKKADTNLLKVWYRRF